MTLITILNILITIKNIIIIIIIVINMIILQLTFTEERIFSEAFFP